jgi:hypothetical protein
MALGDPEKLLGGARGLATDCGEMRSVRTTVLRVPFR